MKGCHAREEIGYARITFDFDGASKLIARKFLCGRRTGSNKRGSKPEPKVRLEIGKES
jgi:hypothetical protein